MGAGTLSTLSIICFIIAGAALILAAVLFFYFKIPTVIGDLSGKNAKKSIERLRASNEKTGKKSFRTSETNKKRGKLTEPMVQAQDDSPETTLLSDNQAESVSGESTVLLDGSGETELLEETPKEPPKRVGGVKLTMMDDVVMIHTSEVIE